MKTDRELSAAYRLATLDCPLGGEGCPSADELSAAAQGEVPSPRREQIAAILANCTRCAALMQMAGDLDDLHPPRRDRLQLPTRRFPAWLGAALAATLLLAIVPRWWPVSHENVTRGADDSLVQPASGSQLRAAPQTLRWNAPAGVACRITLRTETAEIVFHSDTTLGGRFDLDAAARARLTAGQFLWTAECGGNQLGPYSFTVMP